MQLLLGVLRWIVIAVVIYTSVVMLRSAIKHKEKINDVKTAEVKIY